MFDNWFFRNPKAYVILDVHMFIINFTDKRMCSTQFTNNSTMYDFSVVNPI